eukprot:COSAG02_NODE_3390_length_6822_cov_7.140860_3_plen_129_part_00
MVDLFAPFLTLGQGERPEGTTLALSFRIQPDEPGVGSQLVRIPLPNPIGELAGMMGPPPDEFSKPYWVFGLPLWRYYRTIHIMRSVGLPQLMLERRNYDEVAVLGKIKNKDKGKGKKKSHKKKKKHAE